jgi:hypothetical protein
LSDEHLNPGKGERVKKVQPYRAILGFVVLSIVLMHVAAHAESHCLSYEPAVARLEGKLIRRTFPGSPNYESLQKGDKPEVYWLLDLLHPVCVDQDHEDADLNPAQQGVRRIQLVVGSEVYENQKNLIGKRVVVSGRLSGAHTAHHRAPLLMNVEALVQAK